MQWPCRKLVSACAGFPISCDDLTVRLEPTASVCADFWVFLSMDFFFPYFNYIMQWRMQHYSKINGEESSQKVKSFEMSWVAKDCIYIYDIYTYICLSIYISTMVEFPLINFQSKVERELWNGLMRSDKYLSSHPLIYVPLIVCVVYCLFIYWLNKILTQQFHGCVTPFADKKLS